MFDVRSDNRPMLTGAVANLVAIPADLRGGIATLHIGDIHVLVESLVRIGADRYKGTIRGFGPPDRDEFDGLKTDQMIEFNDENIFAFIT